ncbi:type IA DNA topoisomerase [Opitutus sp. GAS368]|jgi:DNA topoisomerase-3|uniref:type IA DNA topoisomerase n=1 Tax=Opitutus sp. GAS368 TaxID=1882749 RepID=UPI00087D8EA8|nr:type IA DNA topoisomerase [Opitutus sp. GAS368]SDS55691.1 DNA topoisomerase-3 [Opitutus sp. GAS368]
MKCLIIAEKPSVAADLARALGKIPKKGDHYENDEYVISSAVGHLVGLQMPEDIDKKKYGFWRLETLPIIPEEFELQPLPEGKERFGQLKKLLARKDVTTVINACDAGREGELIFTYIYQLTKCKKPFQRLWMSSMTNEGINEAFKHLRSAAQMQGLADAARCRSESDWLIGINGTRALTKRMFGSRAGNVASVGRVQTPTLAIVYNRELEIRNFKPRGYWRITANFGITKGSYEGSYQRPDFKKNDDEHDRIDRLWVKQTAEAIVAACSGQPVASVTEEKKGSTSAPPRLYDLTTLQREANGRFGFPAKRTLQIAQALYERHKMITYPRTDSRALPEDYIPLVRQTLGNLHGDLKPHAERVLESGWVQPNKRIFNNAQVSDHFAIIPTQHEAKHLDEAEAKLFDMIARRFVATFHPVAEFDITTRISTVAGHAFKTEGKVLTAPGWLAVYGKNTVDEDSPDSKALPALSPQDKAKARTLDATLHEESTRPPPRYTEATLLSAMEGAGKLVDDEELAEAMKERGLGTPATRADTIEGLVNQKYLDRNQRELVPSTKAEQLFQFLGAVKVDNLTSPAMTGEWEFHLREMEHNKYSREKFMAEIVKETKGIVERVKGFEEDDSVARVTDIISPTDNKPLKETLRGYKSQDGALMVYKIVGGRRLEESEVRTLVEQRAVGPLDGFISNKTRNRFSAVLKLEVVEETKKDKATKKDVTTRKWKTAFDFGDKVDIATLTPFWTDPKTGAEICESGSSFIVREKKPDGTWEQTFRVGRIMCQKQIPPEQAIKLVGEGKTDLIENFISKKGRPFSAFLKRDGGKFSWEFPPRAPKLDKDGNPVVRKARAKADLSKATVLGESKSPAGQLVELGDAYYVRKPDQDNRQVFKLSKKLCEIDIPVEQVRKLLEDGRSDLIENFVSKRGNKFSAYLVLSQKQDKAEFEFPPR